ncbi:MAG: alpha/beta hydrolase [Burkholderiales bacterium]
MPFVTAAGHKLEYELIQAADESKPTLVFLHEGLGSIRQWRDFPLRVARATGCAALVYSRYGYGHSDVLEEPRRSVRFMHEEALESLPEVLAETGIRAPVLVGHSDGASIAIIYAGAGHPARALALMAPHVFVEEVCIRSIEQAKRDFESTDLPHKLGRYHRDPRRSFYLWNDVWLDPAFLDWNIEEYLPGISCPVLAIQGADDVYGTMAQLQAIALKVKGPCELVELKRCGHSPFRDQPDATLDALVRFIDGLAVS